jgi:hypothetical protein
MVADARTMSSNRIKKSARAMPLAAKRQKVADI